MALACCFAVFRGLVDDAIQFFELTGIEHVPVCFPAALWLCSGAPQII